MPTSFQNTGKSEFPVEISPWGHILASSWHLAGLGGLGWFFRGVCETLGPWGWQQHPPRGEGCLCSPSDGAGMFRMSRSPWAGSGRSGILGLGFPCSAGSLWGWCLGWEQCRPPKGCKLGGSFPSGAAASSGRLSENQSATPVCAQCRFLGAHHLPGRSCPPPWCLVSSVPRPC